MDLANLGSYRRPDWYDRAACRGVGLRVFFTTLKAGREICASCPVKSECLAVAIADPDLQGLWGGTDERERKALRRELGWRKPVVVVASSDRPKPVSTDSGELSSEGQFPDDESESLDVLDESFQDDSPTLDIFAETPIWPVLCDTVTTEAEYVGWVAGADFY